MMKHRGLFLALGLTALLGLSARNARRELTLEVVYGGGHVHRRPAPVQTAVSPNLANAEQRPDRLGLFVHRPRRVEQLTAPPRPNARSSRTLAP